MDRKLAALRQIDFDWAMHLDGVWSDSAYDVPELQRALREDIREEVERVRDLPSSSSPLGWVLVGAAGSGKTHLLSTVRRAAVEQHAGFILVDLTDVHDFWQTVLLGYLASLQKKVGGDTIQYEVVLGNLIDLSGMAENGSLLQRKMSEMEPERLVTSTSLLIRNLAGKYHAQVLQFQDLIRALVLFNSQDFSLFNLGYGWLQGLEIEFQDKLRFRFQVAHKEPMDMVRGLSWMMSLKGPTVLALDQLDAIVSQHHLASGARRQDTLSDEQRVSLAIIEGIGRGLSALRDVTQRTLILVSCLESTWTILEDTVLKTSVDRFVPPRTLQPITKSAVAARIIELRLFHAYQTVGLVPAYPTWPYRDEVFQQAQGGVPREILKACDQHRRDCLSLGRVVEMTTFTPPGTASASTGVETAYLRELDEHFVRLRGEADVAFLVSKEGEEELGLLLHVACRCVVKETQSVQNVDQLVEVERVARKGLPPLHARIRLVYREEEDREEHYCLRVVQQTNAVAYQNRLNAALTASGIDRHLKFRRLVIVRNTEPPTGPATARLTKKFIDAGGVFVALDESELRAVWALNEVEKIRHEKFEQWLDARKPASSLNVMHELMPGFKEVVPVHVPQPAKPPVLEPPAGLFPRPGVPVGSRLGGETPEEQVSVPLDLLRKHVVILAGSGSGKTVLIRRLVEEAALLGVPSILVDSANDLARMGDPWPAVPEGWQQADSDRAFHYHQNAEVVVWTPGRAMGNPLMLRPLPDLSVVAGDPDELESAIAMALESLQEIVAPGTTVIARSKRGVLAASLRYFARRGENSLDQLVRLLADLPEEAGAEITDAPKLARQMADALRAQIQVDVLLRQTGSKLDPGLLFGKTGPGTKTRVSVINFIGLPGLEMQQRFLNQLAMTLFTWVRTNPAPEATTLTGLLVVDEAKDFLPSARSSACKASLMRLTAQARKYGLGIIFATHSPKDIDHTIIQNCATHFYGQASSPRAIEVVAEQIRLRGGDANDVPRMGTGRFYVYSAQHIEPPTKVLVPLCLSHHPPSPLTETEVLDRARWSRPRAGKGRKSAGVSPEPARSTSRAGSE